MRPAAWNMSALLVAAPVDDLSAASALRIDLLLLRHRFSAWTALTRPRKGDNRVICLAGEFTTPLWRSGRPALGHPSARLVAIGIAGARPLGAIAFE
jgi:hypothetical protein